MKPAVCRRTGPSKSGCRFVVWAPHAEEVFVVGTFNAWNKTSHPLAKDPDGLWSADVSGAGPGDEYRFRILAGGKEFLRMDPYASRVTSSTGNAIVPAAQRPAKPEPFDPPPLDRMVIYELHIGTFGKQGNEPGPGNLDGAIDRLSYLKEVGINAVEVLPLAEFPGGFSWGYNPALVFAVESDYGSPRAFRDFVQTAHALGIAVIVDVVYNHLGPGDLDLWQYDGWSENGKGGIYFYNDWRAQTPWGDTRPDYGRKEVREYLRDNALMWIQDYDVDGLRWDATAFVRNVYGRNDDPGSDLPDGWSLMQWINAEVKNAKPKAVLIAEDLRGNPLLTKAQKDGGTGFDAQWDARFVHPVRAALVAPEDSARDMDAVRDAILHRYYLNAFERVIYTESHDEVANGRARVPEEVDPGRASSLMAKRKSTLGAAVVFTTPGIPMLFQGQEFLEDDWFHDQDPIDWTKRERYAGILRLYKDLIRLRLNENNQTRGLCGQEVSVYHVNPDKKLLAYHRWEKGGPGDSVVVIASFSVNPRSGYPVGFPAPGEWIVRLNSDSRDYDSEFSGVGVTSVHADGSGQDGLPAVGAVDIGPYSVLILSQEGQV